VKPTIDDRRGKESREQRDVGQSREQQARSPVHLPLAGSKMVERSGEADDEAHEENENAVSNAKRAELPV